MADEGMTPAELRALPVIIYERSVNAQTVSSRWEGMVCCSRGSNLLLLQLQ